MLVKQWLAARVGAYGLVALVAAICVGCGDSRSPTPPSPLSRGLTGCGLGPIPIETGGPEPCLTLSPRCPMPRPGNARSLVWVSTCSFRGRDAGCQGIQLPGCPTATKIVHFGLANLDRSADRPCALSGEMTIDARATEDGSVRLLWDAQEFDTATCASVGPEQEGALSLADPCCSRTLDVYFPHGDFTFRVEVRTDWQP